MIGLQNQIDLNIYFTIFKLAVLGWCHKSILWKPIKSNSNLYLINQWISFTLSINVITWNLAVSGKEKKRLGLRVFEKPKHYIQIVYHNRF